ncbi:MAG TPA: VWA domain-containing protein, partial [Vicinamibacteria bacterium]
MTRRARAASSALALIAAAPAPPQPPRFASQVELVTVDAVVLDRSGQLVRGLTADDFALWEDGQPQPIASFEAIAVERAAPSPAPPRARAVASNQGGAATAGRSFVLLVDDVSLAPSRREDVRRAILRLLEEGLADGDELVFATSSGDAWWSARIPEGRDDVAALAARVRGRRLLDNAADAISEWEAFRITHYEGMEDGAGGAPGGPAAPAPQGPPTGQPPASPFPPGSNLTERVRQRFLARAVCDPLQPPAACYAMVRSRAQQIDARRRNRTRDVLSVVDRAVFALSGVRGRKSLLLLTEGFLSDSELGFVQEVAGRCREANIAVYSIDVRGLVAGLEEAVATFGSSANPSEMSLMRAEQVDFAFAGATGLAEDTGGFALRHSNDLAGGALRAAAESRVHYLLGYAPPPGKSALDWRRLRVEVKRPGLTVRARKGYTLRNAADIAAAAEARLAAERGDAPPLPADVARAMASGHAADGLPLRAAAYVLEDRP